jgi:hypothetical protein
MSRTRFEHRLARLDRKAGRSLLDDLESESKGEAHESN